MLLLRQSGTDATTAAYDSSGAVRVYLKQDVEKFLFRGADLMWPGIFHISTEEFKQNDVVVILARNTLISDYISTFGDEGENQEDGGSKDDGAEKARDGAEDEEGTRDESNAETAQVAPSTSRRCPNGHALVYR